MNKQTPAACVSTRCLKYGIVGITVTLKVKMLIPQSTRWCRTYNYMTENVYEQTPAACMSTHSLNYSVVGVMMAVKVKGWFLKVI